VHVGNEARNTKVRSTATNISRFLASSLGYSSQNAVMIASSPPKVLSRPSVINMRKNIIAQKFEKGIVAIASGYTMNTSPGPVPHTMKLFRLEQLHNYTHDTG